jgi:transposase-like protein
MRERNGYVYAKVVDNVSMDTIQPMIESMVPFGATVYTDEWLAYNKLHEKHIHGRVNHGPKEFVNQMASTNCIENF